MTDLFRFYRQPELQNPSLIVGFSEDAGRLAPKVIDYLNEKYFLEFPENEEYDTLAGFILFHHQSLPEKLEEIIIERYRFKVLKVSETKLELVKLKLLS